MKHKYIHIALIVSVFTSIMMSFICIGIWWQTPKLAFVSHQQLFDGYQGRIDVAQILEKEQQIVQQAQDSILLLNVPDSIQMIYQQKYQMQQQQLQQKAEQYTSQIWEQINISINKYGQEKGYTYILGAAGNGRLMYADSTKNITPEVLSFLNQQYEKQ